MRPGRSRNRAAADPMTAAPTARPLTRWPPRSRLPSARLSTKRPPMARAVPAAAPSVPVAEVRTRAAAMTDIPRWLDDGHTIDMGPVSLPAEVQPEAPALREISDRIERELGWAKAGISGENYLMDRGDVDGMRAGLVRYTAERWPHACEPAPDPLIMPDDELAATRIVAEAVAAVRRGLDLGAPVADDR